MTLTALTGIVLFLTFIFGVTNGFLDGGSLVSTVIATRAMEPAAAIILVATCEMAGLFLFGHAVIHTFGFQLLQTDPAGSSQKFLIVLVCALSGALVWNLAMWNWALPSSSSHALLGGLAGAVTGGYGLAGLHWPAFLHVVLLLGIVPLVSLTASFGLSKALYWLGEFATPAVGSVLERMQVAALAGLALSHGSNDGQKCMGVILLTFLALGHGSVGSSALPGWATLFCGTALATGVIAGSRRTLTTMGRRFYRIQNLQGFCAQTASFALVAGSSLAGVPMSTAHVLSGAVIGAGAAVRPGSVRWALAGDIALAWLVTIPASAALAALGTQVFFRVLHVVP